MNIFNMCIDAHVNVFPPWSENTIQFCLQMFCCSSVAHDVQLFATPWTAALWLPCPSVSPVVCSSSCPSSWWRHPAILSCVIPFSSCPHSFPASGSFPMSQIFASDGQGIEASASILWMSIQGWFPLGLTGLTSLLSKGLSRVFSKTSLKASVLQCLPFFMVQISHLYMTTGKTIALNIRNFVGKVMSLLFNMLSRFVIAFLPRSKCFLISWLQTLSIVILELKKIKSVTLSIFSPSVCHEVMGPDGMILDFWMLSFKPAFSLSSFTCIEVKQAGWQYKALMYSFPNLKPVHCSTSSSNYCFFTCMQVSWEAGKVVWYSHFFKNFQSLLWSTQSKALA